MMGFKVEDDLNTDRSRELWLEWKRRIDPGHFPDPRRGRRGGTGDGADPEALASVRAALEARHHAGYQAGLDMMREGLIDEDSFWGTVNCDGIGPGGDICGVTTTSGLSWKIPGRAGDSPILGAGLYVDGEVGAAGSTGRGEANLFNLSSFLIVENMREACIRWTRGWPRSSASVPTPSRIASSTRGANPTSTCASSS